MVNGESIGKIPILIRCAAALLLIASITALAWARPTENDFHLVVTIVTGEHSRDSNSTTTTLTVSGDTLVYQQSYHGAHAGGRQPVKREYKLTVAEREKLLKLMQEKHLLVTKTLTTLSPVKVPGFYFSLIIRSRFSSKEHSITIELPRDAPRVKADLLYQDSVSLVQQLYRYINRTDPDVSMPQLIS